MKYITGVHALNINCKLDTTGDWHQSALAWKDIDFRESTDSVFGEWGIELGKSIPEHGVELFAIADHIRACLDLIDKGQFWEVQGMREDFICNEDYNQIIFDKVILLHNNPSWNDIDKFLESEYMMKWVKYKEEREENSK